MQRVERTLKYGEIDFSSRTELNDPFELRIALAPPAKKKLAIAGLLKSVQRAGKRRGTTAKDVMRPNLE